MPSNLDTFQNSFQQIPKAKQEAHFVVNDIARKLLNNEEVSEEERDLVKGIFIELQDLDRDLMFLLEKYCGDNTISSMEFNVVASFFLISLQVGPDSRELRKLFYEIIGSPTQIQASLDQVSIPGNSKQVLMATYEKMFHKKHSQGQS